MKKPSNYKSHQISASLLISFRLFYISFQILSLFFHWISIDCHYINQHLISVSMTDCCATWWAIRVSNDITGGKSNQLQLHTLYGWSQRISGVPSSRDYHWFCRVSGSELVNSQPWMGVYMSRIRMVWNCHKCSFDVWRVPALVAALRGIGWEIIKKIEEAKKKIQKDGAMRSASLRPWTSPTHQKITRNFGCIRQGFSISWVYSELYVRFLEHERRDAPRYEET